MVAIFAFVVLVLAFVAGYMLGTCRFRVIVGRRASKSVVAARRVRRVVSRRSLAR